MKRSGSRGVHGLLTDSRILFRLIVLVVFLAVAGYLFSQFPKPGTADEFYEWAPFLVVCAVVLMVEMLLLSRQPERDRRLKLRVWDGRIASSYIPWTRNCLIGAGLAVVGAIIAWETGGAVDFHATTSGLVFAEVTIALGLGAFFCAFLIQSGPRRIMPALFVLGCLLLVAAGVASLLTPLGAGWSMRGLHCTYVLAASGVLVLAAGVFALLEARRLGRAPGMRAAAEGDS
jgi:hypothetical protein